MPSTLVTVRDLSDSQLVIWYETLRKIKGMERYLSTAVLVCKGQRLFLTYLNVVEEIDRRVFTFSIPA